MPESLDFITPAEIAKITKVSRWSIARDLQDGKIPSVEIRGLRRVLVSDFIAWIERQKAESLQKAKERQACEAPRRGRGRPRKAAVNKAATAAGTL
jgi:excisionase family DNA binding protein